MAVSGLPPEIQAEIARLEARRAQLLSQREQIVNNAGGAAGITDQIKEEIVALNQEIASVVITIERLLYGAGRNNTTAPAEVKDSNSSATQSPSLPATTTGGRLTTQQAETLAGQTETGTNPPTKPLTETQSVSPNTVSEPSKYTVEDDTSLGTAVSGAATQGQDPTSFYGDPSVDARDNQPGGLPGAGATDDNPDGQSRATTVRILNAVKNSKFTPRPNVLDQYASYTYSLSWYLMPTIRYNDLVNTGKLSYASYSLLAQSGGAPTQPDAGLGRNEFFGLDYYIDNLEIRSVITGKGSNRAHNAAELQFTITETAGVTLIENLYKAVASVYNRPDFPHASALYCLVIKFYGYDDNGKMVSANSNGAIVEKIIPFKIKNITFAIANKVVEYKVEAVAINYTVGFGSNLGVIKSRIELSGTTIKDLLVSGIPGGEKVSPDDGRKTSPTPPNNSTTVPPNAGTGTVDSDGGLDTSGSYVAA